MKYASAVDGCQMIHSAYNKVTIPSVLQFIARLIRSFNV